MSLRTRLLAVAVGLPGAVLLLALFLFVEAERRTPLETIDELIKRAGAGTTLGQGAALLDLQRRGEFKGMYVVRDAGGDAELKPPEFWTLGAFYAEDGRAPDVLDEGLRSTLWTQFSEATDEYPPFVIGRDYVAARLSRKHEHERTTCVVAALSNPQADAVQVYWVILAGLALTMVLSYWIISRRVVRPLARLASAADRIAAGNYHVEVAGGEGADELGRTVRAVNRMAREIAEYQGQLEERVLSALGRIKKAEQHLAIAQRLAATGKLASGLAHEINNPLGGMKNAVRALARGDLSAERSTLYLDLIADGLSRVEQTVKMFLSFTPRRAEPQPVDLAVVAKKGLALALHRVQKKHIEVETSFPPEGEAMVYGDPHELQQVALNLLLNAADAIDAPSAGRIDVRVERLDGEAVLSVRDNGGGMSPENQDRCFDMFFTTKSVGEGSGMGLAVVHNIVTNHGGRIDLTSAPGEGTTFQVFLPAEALEGSEPLAS